MNGHQEEPQASDPSSGPLYFGLLWDNELELLRPLIRILLDSMEEVIETSYRCYERHFGAARVISRHNVLNELKRAMAESLTILLEQGIAQYAARMIGVGELLAKR